MHAPSINMADLFLQKSDDLNRYDGLILFNKRGELFFDRLILTKNVHLQDSKSKVNRLTQRVH